MNKYGIPRDVEEKIRVRDKVCIYCKKRMRKNHPTLKPSIEHLNNIRHDVPTKCALDCNTPTTLGICCITCNRSRGEKHYWDWFKSKYCEENNINNQTVALIVKRYIKKYPYPTIRKFQKRLR